MQDHAAGMDICLVGEKACGQGCESCLRFCSCQNVLHISVHASAQCLTGRWQERAGASILRAAGIPTAGYLLLQGSWECRPSRATPICACCVCSGPARSRPAAAAHHGPSWADTVARLCTCAGRCFFAWQLCLAYTSIHTHTHTLRHPSRSH